MRINRPARRIAVLFPLALAVAVALPVHGGRAGAAVRVPISVVLTDTTTTSVPATTTTTVPTTTTTTVPTTTTTHPTTTTTQPSSTTTSSSTTTTTTPPLVDTKSNKTPWALIIVIVVVLLLIGLVIALMVGRSRRTALDAWRRRALPALSDARLARDALLSPSAMSDDTELRGAVTVQADRAASALDQAASTAPDPAAGGSATTAAGALRGLAFAVEADRLLRHGAGAPSGVQLAEADGARRDRDAELQGALTRLQSHVTRPAR